jgi:prophage DNA circulation protein
VSWRDQYRQATFRGVAFFVEASDTGHGRRLVVHEYPYRDLPYVEDLGRKARSFSVEGYLVGSDYHVQRDLLITALEQQGPGELVHPYRGTLSVTAGPCQVREDTRDGGTCRLQMNFIEAGAAVFPISPSSPARAMVRAADAAGNASSAIASPLVQITRRPAFVARTVATSWTDALRRVAGLRLRELEKLRRLVEKAGRDVTARLAQPVIFCAEAVHLVQSIARMAARQLDAVRAYLILARLTARRFTGRSSQSRVAATGALAITQLVRETAVAEAARAAAVTTFASYEEAVALREEVLEVIEEVAIDASDASQDQLSEVRRILIAAVPPSAVDLPHLDIWTPPATLPALVIAYRIYRDRERAAEITARNDVEDPLLVPGGEPLEVLVNAA